jgi:hypothetical protein
MTNPVQIPAPGIFTQGNVQGDVSCRKCGYNLRGLPVDGRCPECGTHVGVSVNGDLLRYSDPAYVETLRRGVNFILWGILILIIASFVGGAASAASRGSAAILIEGLDLLAYIPMLMGAWMLTTPDPGGIGEDQYGTARKIIRFALAVGVLGSLVQIVQTAEKPAPALALALGALQLLIGIVSLVGQFAQLNYLHKLALRVPDMELSQRARFLMWAIGISYGLLLVVGFVAIAVGSAGGGGAGLMVPVGLLACGTGIAMLIFGVMYLLMLGKFATRFREQAEMARLIWSRAATAVPEV